MLFDLLRAGRTGEQPLSSVPILLVVAGLIFIFGTDHPAGKWSERHNTLATQIAVRQGRQIHYSDDEKVMEKKESGDNEKTVVSLERVTDPDEDVVQSTVDIAVNETLTMNTTFRLLANPLTWLPALAYLTTFGIELAIDSSMSGILFNLFSKKRPGFTQTTAGYYTSIL